MSFRTPTRKKTFKKQPYQIMLFLPKFLLHWPLIFCAHGLDQLLLNFKDYLNSRVLLSRNYRLIVAPQKFYVLKTNYCQTDSSET